RLLRLSAGKSRRPGLASDRTVGPGGDDRRLLAGSGAVTGVPDPRRHRQRHGMEPVHADGGTTGGRGRGPDPRRSHRRDRDLTQNRRAAAAQWKPAPKADMSTRSPGWMRPFCRASHKANGTVADPMLPYEAMLE